MNKELEALELILEYVNLDEYDYETKGIRNAETLLKKALTPPTRDEVCKALSEYYKFKVDYFDKAFFLTSGFTNVKFCIFQENGRVFVNESYAVPPHLITMIGKFYESLEEEK